jgi:arylsulfatase A-like enzyme
MNVLMIVSDTVRADFLGARGGDVATPNLDALAASSADFRRAYACSFPTLPARSDYLTGRMTFATWGWSALPRNVPTVPMILRSAGVSTAAVVDVPFYTVNAYNYDRGFEFFYELGTQHLARHGHLFPLTRSSEADYACAQTVATAERALERLRDRQPFFLLVDLWDPHEPWDPPRWYVERYRPDYDGRVVDPPYRPWEDTGMSRDDLEVAIACYSGALTMVDRWIGRLLERVDSLGLAGSTAVLFASDHGFYFGERGGLFGKMVLRPELDADRHTVDTSALRAGGLWMRSPLHEEVARVPLLLRIPGEEPRVDDRLVSALDVAPTVLRLLGVNPPPTFLGHPLTDDQAEHSGREVVLTGLPLAVPGERSLAVVDDLTRRVVEWQPVTVTSKEWSLLFATSSEPVELYDANDPDAQNVADAHPAEVARLRRLLLEELERGSADAAAVAARS